MADMTPFLQAVAVLPELRELLEAIESGRCPVTVSGLSPVHRAMVAAALRQTARRPLAVLCADEGEARRMAVDLQTLTGVEPALLFARAVAPGAALGHHAVKRRLRAGGRILPALILALAALSFLLFLQIPEAVVVHGKEPLQACDLVFRQSPAQKQPIDALGGENL